MARTKDTTREEIVSKYKNVKKKTTKQQKKVTSRAYRRLYSMGEDKLGQVTYMLASGKGGKSVARHIQEVWQLHTDIARSTLASQLARYKRDVVNQDLKAKIQIKKPEIKTDEVGATPEIQKVPSEGDPESLDAILLISATPPTRDVELELSELIELQRTRVQKLYNREVSLPVLLRELGGELKLLREMYKDLGQLYTTTGRLASSPDNSLNTPMDARVQEARDKLRKLSVVGAEREEAEQALVEALTLIGSEESSRDDSPSAKEQSDT